MAEGKIVVVDDEKELRELARRYLEREGFEVTEYPGGVELLGAISSSKPDLVILDIMMPKMDGFAVLRELSRKQYVPVLMLTARNDDEDKIAALEMGADDYLTKPFNPRELVARAKAILRRKDLIKQAVETSDSAMAFGSLSVDLDRKQVTVDGRPIPLTVTEFSLLRVLASTPGKIFTREELLDRVWGQDFFGEQRTVDVHVSHLRNKLSPQKGSAQYIQAVWGVGYKFVT